VEVFSRIGIVQIVMIRGGWLTVQSPEARHGVADPEPALRRDARIPRADPDDVIHREEEDGKATIDPTDEFGINVEGMLVAEDRIGFSESSPNGSGVGVLCETAEGEIGLSQRLRGLR